MNKSGKKDMTLSEKDALEDMLFTEKQLLDSYSLAIKEGSTKSIRSEFVQNFTHAQENQFIVFSEMKDRGYYPVMPAEKTQIQEKSKEFSKVSEQLG